MVISWIYVTTLIVVITFAIEIGQKITNTGNMEFADIMFGLIGFLAIFFVFCFVRGIYHVIIKMINKNKKKKMMEFRSKLKENKEIQKEIIQTKRQSYIDFGIYFYKLRL